MNYRFAVLLGSFLLTSISFQPLVAQPNKKPGSVKKASENAKLKVPALTIVSIPGEPVSATAEAVPVKMGKSEVYFKAEQLPFFKSNGGDEIRFVWQQVDRNRLIREALAGGMVTVKYIVETDGKVKLADVSETPLEVPPALTEEILKGISQLQYARPAMVKGKPVRYVKKRSFTFLPPDESPANETLSAISNEQGEGTDRSGAVYTFVEQMPAFKGGDAGMRQFMVDNIKYPQKARDSGIEGKVYVSFIVEPDGRVTNPKIIKGLGYDLDEEVLRVAGLMHFEQPGKQNGRAVRVNYTYPVMFSLGKNK